MQQSLVHSSIAPRNVGALRLKPEQVEQYQSLRKIGYCLDASDVRQMIRAYGMDALQGTVTTASIPTPIEFLRSWMPGNVEVVTAARKIDSLIGIMTLGNWDDEEVIQGLLEMTGTSISYGDYTNVPYSSWNHAFERRTVVRFEEGLRVGTIEEMRAARINVNSGQEKRNAASLALEIRRNQIGFSGFNSGNNRTYGLLNDPGLPAYINVPNGAAGTPTWATKTYLEIIKDIVNGLSALRNGSKDIIDPNTMPITMALATVAVDRLSTVNVQGTQSVRQWLTQTYPNVRVESAPEFNAANGGANVGYLYAENIPNSGTDGGAVIVQIVPTRFKMLGISQQTKYIEEDYSNATAGVMVKRPYGTYRFSGI